MENSARAAGAGSPSLEARAIMPTLTVNDLEKSLQFYVEGLGFDVMERTESDGEVVFVALQAGDASLGLGRDDFAKGRDRIKGVGMRLWISTEQDIVALANRAKGAGLTLDGEPEPLPWGPLAFSVKDPDGFAITFSAGG